MLNDSKGRFSECSCFSLQKCQGEVFETDLFSSVKKSSKFSYNICYQELIISFFGKIIREEPEQDILLGIHFFFNVFLTGKRYGEIEGFH